MNSQKIEALLAKGWDLTVSKLNSGQAFISEDATARTATTPWIPPYCGR